MILTTKLNIPRPEADTLVDRPRLVTALNRPLPETGPVLLVQAPAGFGKTTALAQWAAARKTPPAWVSLDEGDNAPQRFWIYVLNALENRFPKHFAPLITLVETGQHPGWAETITALLNTIHALATPVTLVLDDLHRVESPMVLDGLNFMVDHPLAGFTLVLASRTRPPLGLSRLRGRGRLGEINARDLAFNPKEIQSLTRGFAPPPMDTPTLDLLFEKTEGWIAGVKLALISLGENPKLDLKKFSGNAAHVRDFLMEEVYTHLPPHLKKTMARLAVLDRFSPDLCRALGGRPTCLEEMKSRHLFLIPLDNEGIWYRFHHLFQDFLARLLPEMEDPARAHDLAAQYFETHDLFEEGFAHALAARTPDRAAHILAKKAVDLYDWGGDDALWPHLSQLPQTAIDQEPILVCYQACILTYQGKFEAISHLETKLNHWTLPPKETRLLEGFHAAVQGYYQAYVKGDMERARTLCQKALDKIPVHHAATRALAHFLIGMTIRFQGDTTAARPHAHSPGAKSLLPSALTAMNQTSLEFEMGNLKTAKTVVQEEIAQLTQTFGDHPPSIYGLLFIYQGVAALEENRLAPAKQNFTKGMAVVGNTKFVELVIIALGETARFLRETAQFARAHEAVDQAMALSAQSTSWIKGYMEGIKQTIFLKQGERPPVTQWLKEHRPHHPPIPFLDQQVEFIRIRHDLTNPQISPNILPSMDALIQTDLAQNRLARPMELLVLKAHALFALGQDDRANQSLTRALKMAAPQGYIRFFTTHFKGEESRILNLLPQLHLDPDFTQNLKAALAPTQRAKINEFMEEFNTREIAILKGFAQGLSNGEVAQELHLSVNTIRWYAAKLFAKLDVKRRGQAVARARELGMIA